MEALRPGRHVSSLQLRIQNGGFDGWSCPDVIFENVKVPVENLLGRENGGFQVIMANFNHERWSMVVGATRAARLVTEECFKVHTPVHT